MGTDGARLPLKVPSGLMYYVFTDGHGRAMLFPAVVPAITLDNIASCIRNGGDVFRYLKGPNVEFN